MNTSPDNDVGASGVRARDCANSDAAPDDGHAANDRPLEPLRVQLAELRDFALNYVEARKDSLRASGRRLVVNLVLFVIASATAVVLIATSMVLLLNGLAQVIGDVVGGHPGVGQLVVGGGTLLSALAFGKVMLTVRNWKAYREAREKYEQRHSAQRARFGEDVAGRAAT